MAFRLRTEERLHLHFVVGVRLRMQFQCLISAGDVLLAQFVAFPTLVFVRDACFIESSICHMYVHNVSNGQSAVIISAIIHTLCIIILITIISIDASQSTN